MKHSRRMVLRALGVGAGAAALAGCTELTGGEDDDDGLREIEAWAWTPHDQHLKQAAETFDSEHTVTGEEKSDMDDLWTTGLQSQSGLPPLALVRQSVLANAARQDGLENTDETVREFDDGLFTVAKSLNIVDGEYFSYPNDIGPFILIYNHELFEAAGLPSDPEDVSDELATWEEYMDAAETIEAETGAKMLTASPEAPNGLHGGLRTQAGGGWYNSDGEFEFNQTANVEAYEKLVELLEYAEPFEWFTSRYYQAYADGEVATAPVPGWMLAFFKADVDAEGLFRVTTLPRFKEGGAFGSNWGGVGASIPFFVDDADKEVAREFAEHWHFSEEGIEAKLDVGIPPAYNPGDEVFDKEDDYFGGQAIWKPVLESAENCPPNYRHPNPDVSDLQEGVLIDVVEEGKSVQEALDDRHGQMWDTLDDRDKTVETVD